jgi:mRNA-degrading endonuclease RelE of RelBE toxin-antitoxin system
MTEWILSLKRSFQTDLLALPPKEMKQVEKKLDMLLQDPTPDAKVKKQLKHMNGRLYRLRSGDYRIFYTFESPYISLLALKRRDESTYDEDMDVEFLGGVDSDLDAETQTKQPEWTKYLAGSLSEAKPLPEPIKKDLLDALRVPKMLHSRLMAVETEEALLGCPGVPDDILLRVNEALFERPLHEVIEQPDFVAGGVDDLLRFKEGDLAGFLLKLSAEQEEIVSWNVGTEKPTLVRGGPGSGKSTVALYRVKAIIEALKDEGSSIPRILFTTYTNALKAFSESLLESLLNEDAHLVEVRTADSFAMEVMRAAGTSPKLIGKAELDREMERAKVAAAEGDNALERRKSQRLLENFSNTYLIDEVCGVIQARQLPTIEDYLNHPRVGREEPLDEDQRRAVWGVREALEQALERGGSATWSQVRASAADLVDKTGFGGRYDAVVIDEAQDLEPSALQLLTASCRSAGGLFLTADANQSIYGSSYRWSEVHRDLEAEGAVRELTANFRSTREIALAAADYLGDDHLDTEVDEINYMHEGYIPDCRKVGSTDEEIDLLVRFFRGAARDLRLGIGAAAVLCPNEHVGKSLASKLKERDVGATFMSSKDLDIKTPGVKVITLKAAKGLEFPIVAVAGLGPPYPYLPADASKKEKYEILGIERRTLYVAMTRAMRALLVTIPETGGSSLLDGFREPLWTIG